MLRRYLSKVRNRLFWERAEQRKMLKIMARMRLNEETYRNRFVDDIRRSFEGLEKVLPCGYGEEKRDYVQKLWCHSVILQLADDIRSGKIVVGSGSVIKKVLKSEIDKEGWVDARSSFKKQCDEKQ